MKPGDRDRLLEATSLAYEWHAGHTRKQSTIPYVSHLLQVKGLVLEHAGDTDQAIAGLLHDALEDAPDPESRRQREAHIQSRFGWDVLEIVLQCTDTQTDEALETKRPWRERKERFLERLRSATDRSLLVAACDKRHNLHALVWDVETHGTTYFQRFNADAQEQLWYFEQILDTLRGRIPDRLFREIESLVAHLRRLVDADAGALNGGPTPR
jgi:(p)ppGpp synthase/HD superfamily hydrolase